MTTPPWERQPDEDQDDFHKFQLWLENGFPKIPAFKALCGRRKDPSWSIDNLYSCSSRNNWRERASQWQSHRFALMMVGVHEQTREAARRQSDVLESAMRMLETSLVRHIEKGSLIPTPTLPSFIKTTIELLRLLQGKSTSNVALAVEDADVETLRNAKASLEKLLPKDKK